MGWSRRSKTIAVAGVVVLASAGGAFVSSVPHSADASAAAVTVDLSPVADTYVTSGAPTSARGTTDQLQAADLPGHHKTSYLRFQVPTWGGLQVTGAELALTRTNHHLSATVVANRVGVSDWNETTMTAQTAPAVGAVLDTRSTTSQMNSVSLDVLPVVQQGTSVTIALTSPSTDNWVAFRSREAGAGAPDLRLTLRRVTEESTAPSSAPTPPSSTPSATPPPATTHPATTAPPSTPPTTTPPTSPSPSAVPPPPPPSPGGSTLFGAWPGFANQTDHSESWGSRLSRISAQFGGKLPVVRIYQEGNLTFPNLVNPATGYASVGIISYTLDPSAVAAGNFDSQLLAVARQAPTARITVFSLDHEPDQPGRPYTAAQYVAGFRHFATIMRSIGNPNIKVAPIYMNYTVRNDPNALLNAGYWPGDAYADFYGIDAYFSTKIPKLTTPSGVFGNPLSFAAAHGKQLLVAETSLGAGIPHGGEGWTDQQWTDLVKGSIALLDGKAFAVSWFESWKSDGDWRMDSANHFGYHAGAIAAWSAVARR